MRGVSKSGKDSNTALTVIFAVRNFSADLSGIETRIQFDVENADFLTAF
jgi:hypothetical protein